jgi:hypothetical protein
MVSGGVSAIDISLRIDYEIDPIRLRSVRTAGLVAEIVQYAVLSRRRRKLVYDARVMFSAKGGDADEIS